MTSKYLVTAGMIFVCLLVGCADPYAEEKAAAKKQKEEEKKELTDTGIFGQKTNRIFEFDPAKDAGKVSDGKMKPTSPLNPLGALNAYKPAIEKIVKLKFQQLLQLYWAANDGYPKTFEEFQREIVEPNKQQLQLPVLPGDWVYKYDVKNHELVVVEDKALKKEESKDSK